MANRYDGYKIEVFRHERGNKNSLPNNVVRCLFTDSQGVIWIGTEDGLAFYNNNLNSFQSYFNDPRDENSLSSGWISVIREDANGILWIGTNSGLCSLNKKNNHSDFYYRNSNSISGSYNVTSEVLQMEHCSYYKFGL
jgi:ligand-binding sensor domain-containing protein